MEFSNIGAICEKCKQQDFCPFNCNTCNKSFCHKHFNNHQCLKKEKKYYFFDCPLCSKKIKSENELGDTAVNQHIETNCIKLHPEKYCSEKKCKYKYNIVCKLCNKKYCINHRNNHKCKS